LFWQIYFVVQRRPRQGLQANRGQCGDSKISLLFPNHSFDEPNKQHFLLKSK